MAPVRLDFQGRRKVETFAGARVQPIGDGVQLPLGVACQVGALRQVLTEQTIRILVGPTLPRAMRIGKADADREPLGQALVLGHLFAPIVRQGFAQRGGYVSEFLREAPAGTRRIRPLYPSQDDQARRPLHQGPTADPLRAPLSKSPSSDLAPCEWPRRWGARQSAPASSPASVGFGHTVTARDPEVSGGVEGAGIWQPPGPALCRPDTVGLGSCCGHIPSSVCSARGPTLRPSSAANDPGPIPGSRFHVRRHSGDGMISFAWQHHSPSGRAVLHLELELKLSLNRKVGRPSRMGG